MLLSDLELKAEIDARRLVFSPPLRPTAIQSASIDLSLSKNFWRSRIPTGRGIDTIVDIGEATAYDYQEQEELDELILEPREFVLGETAEAMTIPHHLVAWIEGKSGRARHGLLVHCTAPHIAPGWGVPNPKRITLELVNLGPVKIRLRAGVSIAQLLVNRLGSPSEAPYGGYHATKGSA